MSKEQQNHQNTHLLHQNRQAYLYYCQQIITYLYALNWLRVMYIANQSAIYNEKRTLSPKNLNQAKHQQNPQLKPLKHKENLQNKEKVALGKSLARYEYDAYGNLLTEAGSSETPFGFTGYQYDEETGLYYANARYYDSNTGRFNREDPFDGDVQTPPSLHRYLYANANPNYYVDPTGKCSSIMNMMEPNACDRFIASLSDPEIAEQMSFERKMEAAALLGVGQAGFDAVKGTLELASQISATLGEGLSGGYFYEGSAKNLRNTLDSVSNGIAHPLDTIQQAHQIHNAKVAAFEQAGDHAAAMQERFRYGTNWLASVFGAAKTIQSFSKSSPKIVVESPDNKLNLNNIEVLSIRDARRLEGDNQGLIFVKEPQGNLNQFFEQFDAGTTGAFSETITQKRAVPALRFDNPNPNGNNFVKFDGIELNTNTVIDRKTNLTTRPKQLQSLQRASGALKRNPNFNGVFEFPNQKAADKAINILRQQNITNIIVRVVESE